MMKEWRSRRARQRQGVASGCAPRTHEKHARSELAGLAGSRGELCGAREQSEDLGVCIHSNTTRVCIQLDYPRSLSPFVIN